MRPLVALALLLAMPLQAAAGVIYVDFELRTRLCPEVSTLSEYRLFKHEGSVSVYDDLTQTEYDGLVSTADATDCSAFATEATATLGAWFTALDSEGRGNLCLMFDRLG